ncbi:hypothetical protein [Planomonospora algeriensis]
MAGPYQVLEAAGAIPVAVAGGDGDGDPDRLLGELAATAFDYAAEWPLRAGLVVDGGEVTHIVLVFCHLAADGLGAEVVLRDLRLLLLRGSVPGPPPPQPLDLARWQESGAGRRVAGIAAGHWEQEYRRVPPTMFGRPAGDAAADRRSGGRSSSPGRWTWPSAGSPPCTPRAPRPCCWPPRPRWSVR